jgi:CBS domain-containing protein
METVRDILRHKGRHVHTVSPDATVHNALINMAENNIGALLVVDEQKKPVGIFSERDYARRMIENEKGPKGTMVSEVMTTSLTAVTEERTVEECMALMTRRRIRHLPVVDNDEIVGMVSIGDVVNAVIHQQAFMIDQLEHYISGSL